MAGHSVPEGSLQWVEEDDASESISVTSTQADEVKEDEEKSYYVERILAEHNSDGKMFYLIRWDGYLLAESTWEPEENIEDRRTIDEWNDEKILIGQGLSKPFDLRKFEAEVARFQRKKIDRRRRRRARRKRLRIPVSESDAEDNYDSESSTEAEEVPESPEDPPSVARRRKSGALTSGPEGATGRRGDKTRASHSAPNKRAQGESRMRGQKRDDDDNSVTSDDSLVGEILERAARDKTRRTKKRTGDSKQNPTRESGTVTKDSIGEVCNCIILLIRNQS
jgi:hypothetical protein